MARASAPKLSPSRRKQWLKTLQTAAITPERGHSSPRYRVVLDTNVWVSGLLYGGNAESVIRLVLSHHELVCCEDIVDELLEYLGEIRPRLARSWLRTLRMSLDRYCVPVEATEPSEIRDPQDEPVVALAAAADAIIVTGDKDFLEHKGDLGVDVLALADALVYLD